MTHGHFDLVTPERAQDCRLYYRHRVTGLLYAVRGPVGGLERGCSAVPVLPTGEALPVHCEPVAWGADVWDTLEHLHSQR